MVLLQFKKVIEIKTNLGQIEAEFAPKIGNNKSGSYKKRELIELQVRLVWRNTVTLFCKCAGTSFVTNLQLLILAESTFVWLNETATSMAADFCNPSVFQL